MDGRDIGCIEYERSPKSTDAEDYAVITDDDQKLLSTKSKRNREIYLYPENVVTVGSQNVMVCQFLFYAYLSFLTNL